MQIKSIIFDFGGVILNIDYKRTEDAFRKLGLKDFQEIYSQLSQSNLFDRFEMGKISPEGFRNEIRKKINFPVTDAEIDNAWNAMLIDLPEERVSLLQRLKKDHKLFLLSNTNAIHEKAFTEIIINQYGSNILPELFDKIYLSHHLGIRKPNKEIFELVLRENNLSAADTLFIDDSAHHVDGAKAVGLNAIFLEKNQSILDLFPSSSSPSGKGRG